jgi:hypothetical protein
MAAPIKDELAMAYRAGQAASAERIKALKGAIDKLLSACERLDVYEVKSTELWAAYHFGLNVYDDFVWSPEENAEAAASAERIKALEEALAKADEPQWFYDDRASDEGQSFLSAEEAVEYAVFSALEPPPEGTSILEINTSRPCPSVWAVVKVFTDEEREARDDDEEYIVTLCATEAEARAVLKEADQ